MLLLHKKRRFPSSFVTLGRINTPGTKQNFESETSQGMASVSLDSKVTLALCILEEHFGDIVRDVAKTILTSEQCTLAFLVRSLNAPAIVHKIDAATIRQAMVILLHHNCLIAEIAPDYDGDETPNLPIDVRAKTAGLLYSLNIDNILNRLRFAKVIKIVKNKLDRMDSSGLVGELGVLVIEEVILHGRVRLPQIRQAVSQSVAQNDRFARYSTQDIHNKVQNTFEKLVQNRFLVTVPQLDIKKRATAMMEGAKSKAKNSVFNNNANTFNGAAAPATGKKSTTAASLTSSTIGGKRSRAVAALTTVAAASEEQDALPVELRIMMDADSAAATAAAKEAKAAAAREAGTVEPEPKISTAGRGGRGGGRTGGRLVRGGRGRGRGAGADTAAVSMEVDESAVGANRSGDSGDASLPAEISLVREEVMWMIGWDQLIREERHSACVSVASDRMEGMAGEIVSIILAHSMNSELGSAQAKSSAVSVDDIFNEMQKNKKNIGADAPIKAGSKPLLKMTNEQSKATVKKLLEVMRLSASGMVLKAVGSDHVEGGPLYMVNIESIIATLRRKTVHNIAIARFGDISGRIIELLQRSKYLEQQTVSDMIILPARETRERLYKLYLDKWVNYMELSKRGDFNPASNLYFWHLDLPRMKQAVLQHLYKAIYNMKLRRVTEVSKGKSLLDFAVTNEADEARYKALIMRLNMLDDAVLKLDRTVMLLDKF